MKPNPDDTLFIKKYHMVLSDNAIKLAREANNLANKCHDTWELEEHQNYYKFTNPVSNHVSTVSFNHVNQMSCTCQYYVSYFFVCPHMLVILEQRVMPEIIDEDKDIDEIITLSHYHKKKQINEIIETGTQFVQMSQEPIIIQSQRPPRAVPANDRYNQLHSVFQRFVATATTANQNGFEKMLYSFERLTELSYQNQTDLHYNFFLNQEETQEHTQDDSFLPDIDMTLNQAYIRESPQQSPQQSAPFLLVPCSKPVGRPSGTAQSAVSFSRKKHKKVTFNEPVTKKSKTVKEKKTSNSTTTVQTKNKTISTKKTKTTVTTETTTTTTTTSNDYAGSDDTQLDEESFSSIKEQEEQEQQEQQAGPSKRLRSRRV
jgi:hypothetical protein